MIVIIIGHLHELGIYVGVPVAILLLLLVAAIVIIGFLVFSIVRMKKEWRGETKSYQVNNIELLQLHDLLIFRSLNSHTSQNYLYHIHSVL